ncbi:MAG: ferritin [Candidatus Dactylopiibacterium carminicum]|uniref:Ferritin n=1 Tax=Candidatus Dactylopiibacterium carminicum TaxID=857335 RepID=A0A272EP45_9RHOO|nr:ferritin [Candidatus Dactylopiibacterium carminicum]KAF7598219.1 ferritin [Candidatus Dactylopiibacterium carminicum]PAS91871.1 MAG: ferritin [Candidatus Dactylopiibacterium carminicum]PAS94846.1 MAG: ferritin [Candidatus Dactylopiibacterium carminicum]
MENRIASLDRLCARHGVPRPLPPLPQETVLESGWRANLIRAIRGEQASAARYQRLWQAVPDAGLRDAFAGLQRETLQRQLPPLQQALQDALALEQMHARAGVPPEEAYTKHGLIGDFMEKTFSVLAGQHHALGVVAPLFKANPALLAGLAAGSLGLHFARQRLRKDRKES